MKSDLSFEAKILSFICVLCMIRILFSGIQVYMGNFPSYEIIHLSVYALFFLSIFLLIIYGKYTKTLSRFFCVLLLILVGYAWLKRDGLASTTSCNLICAMIVFSALSKGRFLYFIIITTFLFEILLLYVWMYQPLNVFGLSNVLSNEHINYQLMLLMITVLVIYFALEFDSEYMTARARKIEVKEKIEELNRENHLIALQQEKLKELNTSLENKIAIRVGELIKSNRKISKYLRISAREISPAVTDLMERIEHLSNSNSSEYSVWLRKSAVKLVNSFTKMKYDGR